MAVVWLLLSGGCATRYYLKGEASRLIAEGEKLVSEARSANAATTASAELKEAEETLSKARKAFGEGMFDQAGRTAKEGVAAAEYSREKAVSEKSKMEAEEVERNLEALRREIGRQSQSN